MAEEWRDKTSPRNALVTRQNTTGRPNADAEDLPAFMRHLAARYGTILRAREAAEFRSQLFAIQLAVACLDRDEVNRRGSGLPPQIVLLGPTQAGKSSLVNWLLGANHAEVSPLAGFTVNPQGFCWGCQMEQTDGLLGTFFRDLHRLAAETLTRDRFDGYTLQPVANLRHTLPPACLWDTPDFDSVDSESYRSNLLRILGLADFILLVLSKDKYSDQSVWDMLALLEPFGHPAAIVLNKIDDPARDLLVGSLEEKWCAVRPDPVPLVITIPFLDEGDTGPTSAVEILVRSVEPRLQSIDRTTQRRSTRKFLQRHWTTWLNPIRAEHQAREEWRQAIAEAVDEAMAHYQREYLEHPQHYETFQRALARLLTLLEIPGVAGALATTRRILTWPYRQVSTLGRRLLGPSRAGEPKSGEQTILEQIAEHVLLKLDDKACSKRDIPSTTQEWWRDLAVILRTIRAATEEQFQTAHGKYAESFQSEIDRTARDLHERLETRPVVLNSLRATRITTDAAALALALHSGGIGIQDFVIAPATLSLTSMLTESALGRYVNHAAKELKGRQLAAVRLLFEQALREPLQALPDRLDDSRHFHISSARVERAEVLLATYA